MATPNSVALDLAEEFGEYTGDSEAIDQLESWVQDVYDNITLLGRWNFLAHKETVTLVPAQAEYALSSDMGEIIEFNDTDNDVRVPYVPIERLVAREVDVDAAGDPTSWAFAGLDGSGNLKVSFTPVPNGGVTTLEAYGQKRPARMATSDVIEIPNDFLAVLKEGVRSKVRYTDGDLEGFTAAQQTYLQGIQIMAQRHMLPPGRGSRLKAKRNLRVVRHGSAQPGSI
jgi:hypothetical protein